VIVDRIRKKSEGGTMAEASFHYDVLVVGAGNAACSAANAALDEKASVGLLEKASRRDRGGNSALTGHMRFVFNGIEDVRPLVRNTTDAELHTLLERMPRRTEADLWDEIMRVTNNQSDQDMLQVHVAESLNTVQWLAARGHDWPPAGFASFYGKSVVLACGSAGSGRRLFAPGGGFGMGPVIASGRAERHECRPRPLHRDRHLGCGSASGRDQCHEHRCRGQ
jgi:succinate dehydrogenase/fumarate reductase flavoprotein subunit